MFSTADVAPTIAALAGADRPERLAGRSVLPIFNGDPVLPEVPANLSEFGDRVLVETERYKAVFHARDRRCLALHDLLRDPDESINLVRSDTADVREAVERMRRHLAEVLLPVRA